MEHMYPKQQPRHTWKKCHSFGIAQNCHLTRMEKVLEFSICFVFLSPGNTHANNFYVYSSSEDILYFSKHKLLSLES